ncbi:hypothetical protein BJ741DRAFT_160146 [Chytriomyces cf. hyalinus JEL632]|nr:hypothetical protein BJ741DRAFT_160146 [Chytriomyces cf. hyalinus JEL632]
MNVVNIPGAIPSALSIKSQRERLPGSGPSSVVGGSGPRFRPNSTKRTLASAASASADTPPSTCASVTSSASVPPSRPISAFVSGQTFSLQERPMSSRPVQSVAAKSQSCLAEEVCDRIASVTLINAGDVKRDRQRRKAEDSAGKIEGKFCANDPFLWNSDDFQSIIPDDDSCSMWAPSISDSLDETGSEHPEDQAIVSFTIPTILHSKSPGDDFGIGFGLGLGGICAWEENADDALLARLLIAGSSSSGLQSSGVGPSLYSEGKNGVSYPYLGDSDLADALTKGDDERCTGPVPAPQSGRLNKSSPPSNWRTSSTGGDKAGTAETFKDTDIESIDQKKPSISKNRNRNRPKTSSSERDWTHFLDSGADRASLFDSSTLKRDTQNSGITHPFNTSELAAARQHRLSLLALEKSLRPSAASNCGPIHKVLYKEHAPPSYSKIFSSTVASIPSNSSSFQPRLLDSDVIVCRKYSIKDSGISLRPSASTPQPSCAQRNSLVLHSDEGISNFLKERRSYLQDQIYSPSATLIRSPPPPPPSSRSEVNPAGGFPSIPSGSGARVSSIRSSTAKVKSGDANRARHVYEEYLFGAKQ